MDEELGCVEGLDELELVVSGDALALVIFGIAMEEVGMDLAGLLRSSGETLSSSTTLSAAEVKALPSFPSVGNSDSSSANPIPDDPGPAPPTLPALVPGRLEDADNDPEPVPMGAGIDICCFLLSASPVELKPKA